MSKKNWLKNLIFEDTPQAEEEKKEQEKRPESQIEPIVSPAASEDNRSNRSIPSNSIVGKIDKTLLDKLCAVLDEQSCEGIDYLKFKKSVDSLKDFQPEENIRFTTAYLTLKATYPSFSKEYLTQTIDKYIQLMEHERKVGMDQLNNLRVTQIESKEKDLNTAIQNVEKMKAEIQKLTRYIAETEMDITTRKNEFTIREADFNTTVDQIVNQLKNDKVKIETIIKH
ncbi:MAG: hypothetical protein FWF52_07000 [Candidatus Azobacteroides sp.]|nr:hypothetical protein [Candidatus Azobacteroides sp.]